MDRSVRVVAELKLFKVDCYGEDVDGAALFTVLVIAESKERAEELVKASEYNEFRKLFEVNAEEISIDKERILGLVV
jgi:hypothetical protein